MTSDTVEDRSKRKSNEHTNASFLQVPNIVNLQPESRYQVEQDQSCSPIIRVTPPSLHGSISMSNVSTVVVQIETNIPSDIETKSNISINSFKDNLDVRIDDNDNNDIEMKRKE